MITTRLGLAFAITVLGTTACFTDDVLGVWQRQDGAARVRFEPCGETICGSLIWMKDGAQSRAKTKLGLQLFMDMRPAGANAWTGKAVSPRDGSIYVGKMTIETSMLSTAGCAVGGLLCASVNWTRVP